MVKAAIIGAGFAGDVHAEALRACGVCVEAVVCLSAEEARAFAEKWGIPKWGEDIALAFQEEIDVVHICTPPTTHGELIRSVLKAGKHVMCEKPLCLENEEAKELLESAINTDRICGLMLNVRYHMACQRARQLITSGKLGKPMLIHGTYMQEFGAFPAHLDWRYNEKTAGKMRTVTEIGTHWLDIAQYISGQRVKAVSAQFGCFHEKRILKDGDTYAVDSGMHGEQVFVGTEDAAAVNLRYENGAIGTLLLSGVSQGRGNYLSLEITCENGNIWWNEEENNVLNIGRKGEGIQKEVFAFGNGFADTFRSLMRAFYDAVEKGEKTDGYPGFDNGAAICRVCCAIWESAQQDARWIEIGG